ncbi:hypothetical protein BH23ACT5_BH23ACT5_12130 [soil metagenome]
MRTTLLFFHIAAAAAWFGANVTQMVVTPHFAKAGGESAARWWRATVDMGRFLYMPASIIVLVTGILLVTTQPAYSFADLFVSIGLLAVVIGVVLGIAVFAPRGRKAAEFHDRGEAASASSVERAIAGFGAFDTLVLGVTILAMVSKWGA